MRTRRSSYRLLLLVLEKLPASHEEPISIKELSRRLNSTWRVARSKVDLFIKTGAVEEVECGRRKKFRRRKI